MKGQKTSVNDAGDSIVGLPGPESTVRPDAVVLTIVVKLQEVCALTFVLNMKMMTSMMVRMIIMILLMLTLLMGMLVMNHDSIGTAMMTQSILLLMMLHADGVAADADC